VKATVTRQIDYLDSTGAVTGTNVGTAAGWILQGTFNIDYDVNGLHQHQSITVARSVR